MAELNSTIAVFTSHDQADAAVKALQKGGFDMRNLSIVGKDFHTEQQAVGYYNTGDRVRFWGKKGAFWGGLAGVLFSSAFLVVPVLGQVIVLGPLVSAVVGGLEGAAAVGGASALVGALTGLGVPKDSVIRYEAAVKEGKFLVVAHGSADEVARAKAILAQASPDIVAQH